MIIAATGHRPDKLGGYGSLPILRKVARAYLAKQVSQYSAITGISGLAVGWDTAWALEVIRAKLPLIAAIPCDNQDMIWPVEAQRTYRFILQRATNIIYVSKGGYEPWKMQKRNQWMVDRSDRIAAMWNGSEGGTANCLQIARLKRVPVDNLWPEYQLALGKLPGVLV